MNSHREALLFSLMSLMVVLALIVLLTGCQMPLR